MKYYLVLVHSRTKFELDNSKFAQVRQFMSYSDLKIEHIHASTHKNTHASGRQLKIIFNNISKFLLRTKKKLPQWASKNAPDISLFFVRNSSFDYGDLFVSSSHSLSIFIVDSVARGHFQCSLGFLPRVEYLEGTIYSPVFVVYLTKCLRSAEDNQLSWRWRDVDTKIE